MSKEPGRQATGCGRRRCPDRRDPRPAAVRAAGLNPASLPTIFRTTNT
nr:hypothetical protein [Faecalibacterium prausnitzii]